MDLKPELVIADRFRLVRLLGEGGMGSVWLAHHIRLQVPCAVKFMKPEVAAEPAYRDRFDREAIAAAKIRSTHVVSILDHGVFEGAPYIAMEYLEGEDLAARLARQKTLSPEQTVQVLSQVARALGKAHAAGLVHRDLKPPNIFLVREDDHELVKVLDFGIAKISAPNTGSQTKTGAVMGTPYYMSPEQAQGTKTVDHRTDLWALGVVAYECLTGQLPFVSDAFGDLVLKIIVEPIPVPSKIAKVPAGFDAWWARAVDRDPAARFQSAKEMIDALADALEVRAPGPTATALTAPDPATRSDAPPRPAHSSAGTMAGAVTSVGAPPAGRSRAIVAGAIGVSFAVLVTAWLALVGGNPPKPTPAASALPGAITAALPAQPAPTVTAGAIAQTAATAADPAPSATSTAPTASAPTASAQPSALATAMPAPSHAGGIRPTPTARAPGARPSPSAPPTGHDIGF